MPKSIKVAVVQMQACPSPVKDRLAQAENSVVQCAERRARLIILPEVFNTGYEYSDLLASGYKKKTKKYLPKQV